VVSVAERDNGSHLVTTADEPAVVEAPKTAKKAKPAAAAAAKKPVVSPTKKTAKKAKED
jgi:hypothetical protein